MVCVLGTVFSLAEKLQREQGSFPHTLRSVPPLLPPYATMIHLSLLRNQRWHISIDQTAPCAWPTSPQPALVCGSFGGGPCVWWHCQLWGVLVRHSVEWPSLRTKLLCNVLPLSRLGWWTRGRKTTGLKCPYQDVLSKVPAVNLTWRTLALITWPR